MELNLRTVVELVEKVIRERGENYMYTNEETYHRVRTCTNVLFDIVDFEGICDVTRKHKKNFRPGCIVGSAILSTGLVDIDWFFYDFRNSPTAENLLEDIRRDFDVTSTGMARDFLSCCQDLQDDSKGYTWKQAYDYAWEQVLSRIDSDFYNESFVHDEGDLEYIQECFGKFRPEEENAAVSS